MRCCYCGSRFGSAATIGPFRVACPKCSRLEAPRWVVPQGDGITGFREIMLGQNAREPGRKLLETRSFHFTIFVDERDEITGFDLADRDEDHVLKWRRGRRPVYYRVANRGKGYHNHNDVLLNGRFSPAEVVAELDSLGSNIRREVKAVLLEGIHSDRPKG